MRTRAVRVAGPLLALLLGVMGSASPAPPTSGTDAELFAVCLLLGSTDKPLTNIVIAPDETGRGVVFAAKGCHFSDTTPMGIPVQKG